MTIVSVLFSCTKYDYAVVSSPPIENPIIRKDSFFSNGILQFRNAASFIDFFNKVKEDPHYANKLSNDFKSFLNYVDDFKRNDSLGNAGISPSRAVIDDDYGTPSDNITASKDEFLVDMKTHTLPDDVFAGIVNPDMQFIVADSLYQFSRIGLLKTKTTQLPEYNNFWNNYREDIYYNPNFNQIPNEQRIGENTYLSSPTVVRVEASFMNIWQQPDYVADGGGCSGSCGTTTDYFVNVSIPASFNEKYAIEFNDWTKRRFIFQVQNVNLDFGFIGFHKVGLKAKIQRQRRILWITYWGESYGDEIIVGFDNMALLTDYIFPHPQQFSSLSRPSFSGFSRLKLGDQLLNTLDIRLNLSTLGYTLNNAQVSNLIDNQLNRLVGGQYNNLFKTVEENILNSIDPSYLSRYASYTKQLAMLNDQYKLKWVLGKGERPQGYSHINRWTFDVNFGGSWTQNGGVSGTYPAPFQYKYTMKAGSFYGKARVGNVWHGIRMVIRQ